MALILEWLLEPQGGSSHCSSLVQAIPQPGEQAQSTCAVFSGKVSNIM